MYNFISKRVNWILVAILIVVAGFVYSFNMHNQLFWDDDDWIINNVFVHSISWENIKFWFNNNTLGGVGLKSNYYRPFLFLTFALNYVMAGVKPFVYHLTSNAIHIVNGILVFWLVRSISKNRLFAFLVSIIFLIHPLQTEAITYISGRGDALVAMFMLISLALFYKVNTRSDLGIQDPILYYGLSILFLILGLLSRETAIIFPFLALLFYVSFLSDNKFLKSIQKGFVKTWPYFATVFVYGLLRLTTLNFLNTLNFYSEPNPYSENLYIRMFTFLTILSGYLKLLIVPVGLHMERSATVFNSLFQWPVWAVFIGLVGLLAWLRYLYTTSYKSRSQDRGSSTESGLQATSFQIWFFGTLWFFICLGPVSGITPINALLYEHWLYLPMVGFWLIACFYLVKIFDFLKSRKFVVGYLLLATSLIIYLSFFSYQSIRRNILWGDTEKFYKNILKYEPESSRINNNLGNFYFNRGDRDQAEAYYRKAVDLGDAFAQPYFNLGSILQSKGDIFGAMKLYEEAIKINPNFYYPYQNLAVIYAQQGNLTKAIENIEKLKTLLPNNPRVYYNSALIYIALNNRDQALKDLNIGLKYANLDPEVGKLMEDLIKELKK